MSEDISPIQQSGFLEINFMSALFQREQKDQPENAAGNDLSDAHGDDGKPHRHDAVGIFQHRGNDHRVGENRRNGGEPFIKLSPVRFYRGSRGGHAAGGFGSRCRGRGGFGSGY